MCHDLGQADRYLFVMLRFVRHLLALCSLVVVSSGGVLSTSPVASVSAAGAPWTLPTRPPACTKAQADGGNVATCTIQLGPGLPETRGWPAAPFPTPANVQVLTWVNLSVGAADHTTVAKVQKSLTDKGYTVSIDGQFGPATQTAVKAFQIANKLPSTGIVDAATAKLLGVQRTGAGTFPPSGWTWLGWGYNGSTALKTWEQKLVGNTKSIGSMKTNQLKGFAGALPLFEGFYAEIQKKGYVIGDGGTYVFRCTASSRKDCAGLSRASLSNHAYGLASDINTVKNPMQTLYGKNGLTACATPVKTDLPRWVVQTAEKWGLYWGGYGWSSGCTSPTTARTRVTRDPMHFEFNGTVAQARAILLRNVGKGDCYDVADTKGVVTNTCLLRTETPAAGTRTVITTPRPAGATAALVNITLVDMVTGGWVTAESCGAVPTGVKRISNANARPGRPVAASAVVRLDAAGRFCLYQSGSFHTIVDVLGYFAPASAAPTGALYTPVAAARVLDTRSQPVCNPSGACLDKGPAAIGSEVVVSSGAPVAAVATVANLTAVAPKAGGWLAVDSCAGLTSKVGYSNLNFMAGDPLQSNLVVARSASTEMGAQFCTFNSAATDELVDVQGYFGPAASGGLGYTALAPTRALDTRLCWTDPITKVQRCALINAAGSVLRLKAPTGAAAVLVNLTTVGATAAGGATVGKCSLLLAKPPTTPTVQAVVGEPTSNISIAQVDTDGTYCVHVASAMHVVVDVTGTFSAAGPLRYLPITPARLHDSRPPA
jgi:peptidoglycan hydrolase-like protein with peptidoglycan-binding domain